jgi:hypothetical protein
MSAGAGKRRRSAAYTKGFADGLAAAKMATDAVDAVWKSSLVIESSVRRGDGPTQYAEVVAALKLVREAREAVSKGGV